jgi:hypothetical protein
MYPIEVMRKLGLHDFIGILGYKPNSEYNPMFCSSHGRPQGLKLSHYCKFYRDTPIGSNGAHRLLRSLFVDAHIKMRRKVRELPIYYDHSWIELNPPISKLHASVSLLDNSALMIPFLSGSIVTKVYITTILTLTSIDVSFNRLGGLRKIKLRKVGSQSNGSDTLIKYESADNIALMIPPLADQTSTNITSGSISYDFIILKETPEVDWQLLSENLLMQSYDMIWAFLSD